VPTFLWKQLPTRINLGHGRASRFASTGAVVDRSGRIDRRYYELCALWELRAALRAGDVWLETSRRYANPESYLIPPASWPALRPEVCTLTQTPQDGAARVKERQTELEALLRRFDEESPLKMNR